MTSTSGELEQRMVTYRDLLQVPVQDIGEPLVGIDGARIAWEYRKPFTDMQDALGNVMLVRSTVARLLYKAQKELQETNPNWSLLVTYGYRSPAIQEARFRWILEQLSDRYTNTDELYEAAHRRVAVPSIAGHPTGGAVDITIRDVSVGADLDFGSPMYDYATERQYVFYPDISKSQKEYRMRLRTVMKRWGFAPFDGEWWHFSYGDREWAYYYSKPSAVYEQIKR